MLTVTTRTLSLTKHHALGNDFMVLLDTEARHAGLDTSRLAIQVCDRRRGIGADGLLFVTAGDRTIGADVTMELRNSDGSRAEVSGNGLRCLAQAVLDAGIVEGDDVRVATDAGLRSVECVERGEPGFMSLRADMGQVIVLGDDPRWCQGSVQAATLVDAGNPHLVLLDPSVAEVDVVTDGRRIEMTFPEGINVEWIWPGPGPDELELRVWERGAGATLACGSGSCAAAYAAHAWGRAGRRVVVHNPGGDVTVELGDAAMLIGPSARVASVEYPWH